MVTTDKLILKQALCIDFTDSINEFKQFSQFDDSITSLIRNWKENKVLIVIDRAFGMKNPVPQVVQDHINLSGNNPLVGPNDPIGERFTIVNNIYIKDACTEYPHGIAAGLKPGIIPSIKDLELVYSTGANFYCYNLVPTVIVAAHAYWKVIAIATPDKADIKPILASALNYVMKGKM